MLDVRGPCPPPSDLSISAFSVSVFSVSSTAWLLRHRAAHLVQIVSIGVTQLHHPRSQQHKSREPQSRPRQRRRPANPGGGRRRFRQPIQHPPNRRLLLSRAAALQENFLSASEVFAHFTGHCSMLDVGCWTFDVRPAALRFLLSAFYFLLFPRAVFRFQHFSFQRVLLRQVCVTAFRPPR
jgi:hypothetical protein